VFWHWTELHRRRIKVCELEVSMLLLL
jgi:hypothetical protein